MGEPRQLLLVWWHSQGTPQLCCEPCTSLMLWGCVLGMTVLHARTDTYHAHAGIQGRGLTAAVAAAAAFAAGISVLSS